MSRLAEGAVERTTHPDPGPARDPKARDPKDLGPDDLVLSHFTLSRHHPIVDRLDAAAAAGFAGIGLHAPDLARLRAEGVSDAELADLLGSRGLCLADIEVVKGWAGGPDGEAGAEIERLAWQLADRFASRCLQAIGPYPGDDLAVAGRAFGALCDRAADHGLAVALEPLPYTNIPDLATAVEVVARAGRPNGGLCIDIWHLVRGGDRLADVAALDAGLITHVQLDDGPLVAPDPGLDYKSDCLTGRVPPGEGEMDADGFVRTVLAAGSRAPWSIEVCAGITETEPGLDHVMACARGARRVLDRVRAG